MRLSSHRAASCRPSTSGRCVEMPLHTPRLSTGTAHAQRTPPPSRRGLVVTAAAATPGPDMSMTLQQRWRALRFAIKDQKARLAQSPPAAFLAALLVVLRARLQPLRDLAAAAAARRESLAETYNQFLAEETKQKWTWAKRNSKELALLQGVPPYLFYLGCTLAYLVLTPVSFLFSVALPLYYSWVMWDRWWASPVMAGLLLMAPWKFPPWALGVACWVWPGVL